MKEQQHRLKETNHKDQTQSRRYATWFRTYNQHQFYDTGNETSVCNSKWQKARILWLETMFKNNAAQVAGVYYNTFHDQNFMKQIKIYIRAL